MTPARIAIYDQLTTRIPARELSTLLKVSAALASTLEISEVLQIAIESATDLVGIQSGAIYTLEAGKLYLGATTPPLPEQFPEVLRLANLYDHPHICQAVETKLPVYLEDSQAAVLSPAEQVVVDSRSLVSILYFPLVLKENVIGLFILGTQNHVRRFTSSEINLCHILAFQVSLAIANAQLYQATQQAVEEISRAYDATLEGWSRVLDMRDHITDQHTRRVVEQTVLLAQQMGVPDEEIGNVRRGALLHDIGKMAIPDAILQKPGLLAEAEREIMQTHPDKAYEILSHIDYLAPSLDIPYCHHEKWDGSGYPRGLAGESIPLAARIFAVVDVYDALTSDRPYRPGWSKDKALAYLREQSGLHFDPAVVAAFLCSIQSME